MSRWRMREALPSDRQELARMRHWLWPDSTVEEHLGELERGVPAVNFAILRVPLDMWKAGSFGRSFRNQGVGARLHGEVSQRAHEALGSRWWTDACTSGSVCKLGSLYAIPGLRREAGVACSKAWANCSTLHSSRWRPM